MSAIGGKESNKKKAEADCALRLKSMPALQDLGNGFLDLKGKMLGLSRVTDQKPEISRLKTEIATAKCR